MYGVTVRVVLAHQHSVSLEADHRRILEAIEDHADPDLQPPA
jgi:hypothetical protein